VANETRIQSDAVRPALLIFQRGPGGALIASDAPCVVDVAFGAW